MVLPYGNVAGVTNPTLKNCDEAGKHHGEGALCQNEEVAAPRFTFGASSHVSQEWGLCIQQQCLHLVFKYSMKHLQPVFGMVDKYTFECPSSWG